MLRGSWRLAGLAAIVALAMLPAPAFAQTETGRITGTVTDPSGGVLPGATVALKSLSTGATRSAVSDAAGSYTFVGLLPGPYEVSVELAGFSKKQYKTTVTVGGSVAVNARLEVGQQTEVITVVAEEGAQINTTTQEVATTVTSTQLRELPTLTRNPYDLVSIAGNVAPLEVNNTQTRGANGYNINGQRNASTNILLDGGANNDEFVAGVGQQVPLDSVQEFSVISSNFSAQYGRASGGIVNVATKSGSNEFHGSAYEYYRPSSLSANDFDANARGQAKADFKRHQPGGSIGGPLVKDKVFFFGSYELTKVDSTAPAHFAVPTPELIGQTAPNVQQFFAGRLPSPNGGTISVAQVCEQFGCTGGPFSSLPGGMPAFGIINMTAPIDGGAGAQQKRHQAVGRLDFNFGASTTAYVRYAFEKQDWDPGFVSLSPYEGFNTGESDKHQNILGSVTHTFSPNFTSQTKVVYNNIENNQPQGAAGNVPALYLTGVPVSLLGNLIVFPGYLPTSSGIGIPTEGPQKLLQFYQDFNWVKGKHDLRFGGSYVKIMDDHTFGAYQTANETLSFGTNMDGLNNLMTGDLDFHIVAINPKIFPGLGQSVQLPAEQTPGMFTRNNRYTEYALYGNDSWSVTPRLRVNLGVRWEVFGVQGNTDPTLDSNFYFGQGDNFFQQFRNGQLQLAPDSPIGGMWSPDRNNIAPRVGFAWDVNGDGKTSIRGGYGIGFERNFGNVTFNMIQNPPNYGTAQIFGAGQGGSPAVRVSNDNLGALGQPGDVNDLGGIAFSLRHVDQNIKTAFAHFWSFSFQRQVAKNTLASIDYTGSKGVDLYSLGNVNARGTAKIYADKIGLDQASVPASARLNSKYGSDNMRTNGGRSLYNAFTFGVDGHDVGGSGLSITARYTWAKAKDNLSTTFSEGINGGNLGFLDPFEGGVGGGPDLDYGYAEFDVRHRGAVSVIWELPIAKGSSGATKAILNGWSVNGIFTAYSGFPFSLYDCSNPGINGSSMCMRMLEVAPVTTNSSPASSGDINTFNYLDLTPQAPGVGTYVNPLTGSSLEGPFPSNMTKRNQFRGPGNWNVDAMLAKRFQITDKVNLQLRLEAYNVFNHPNLYVDGTTIDAASNTFVRAWRGGNFNLGTTDHRNVQVAVRLNF